MSLAMSKVHLFTQGNYSCGVELHLLLICGLYAHCIVIALRILLAQRECIHQHEEEEWAN